MTGVCIRVLSAAACAAILASAAEAGFQFQSIDGGTLDLDDWRGRPVLVVNTASLCAYSGQYDDLQALQDRHEGRLVVLAVPSDDFRQELADEAAVKEFCAVNFDLTIPMTTITPVTGPAAHPFYAWALDEHGFAPGWNFNKVLIGPDGAFAGGWGASTRPTDADITRRIEALLP